jgi:hypothetical protein
MVQSKKKCMWSNPLALKVKNILTMSINSIRRSMGLSKHQGHGMNALGTFLLKMVLALVRPTLLSSLEKWVKIYLYVKSMLMILYLILLTNLFFDEFSNIKMDRFKMSMMEVFTFFLGFHIKQAKEGTFISQMKYTCDILKKFGMDKAKPIKTPMGTNGHLDLDLGGTSVNQKIYRSIIGSLLYLCASRFDIMLSVCMCARFQAAPKDRYLRAVKRIMRYLDLTPNIGLWYPKGSHFELLGYLDANYAGCKVDRKSTSGTCQFLGRSFVSWSSKK